MSDQSPSSVFDDTKYASFLERFLAYLIDGFALLFLYIVVIGPMLALMSFVNPNTAAAQPDGILPFSGAMAGQGLFLSVMIFTVTWLYFAILESGVKQGTLGKIAIGIMVTDIDGDRLSFAKATIRYFGRYLSSVILMLGYLLAIITHRKQALHDFVANTIVVKK